MTTSRSDQQFRPSCQPNIFPTRKSILARPNWSNCPAEPTRSKTTAVAIYPDDPQRVPEIYAFLPSLRRSLRLSSVARCAPLQGTDWTNDDQRGGFSGIPNWFAPRYLGEKKMLFMVHSQWQAKAN